MKIISSLPKGRPRDVNAFFTRKREELISYSYRYTRSLTAADDAVHDTYLLVLEYPKTIENLNAFVYFILKQRSIKLSYRITDALKEENDISESAGVSGVSLAEDANDAMTTEELKRLFVFMSPYLSRLELDTLRMRVDGLTPEQIASRTGKTEKAINKTIERYTIKTRVIRKRIYSQFFLL